MHCPQDFAHCKLYTINIILHTVYYAYTTTHCILHAIQIIVYTVHPAHYELNNKHTAHCILFTGFTAHYTQNIENCRHNTAHYQLNKTTTV